MRTWPTSSRAASPSTPRPTHQSRSRCRGRCRTGSPSPCAPGRTQRTGRGARVRSARLGGTGCRATGSNVISEAGLRWGLQAAQRLAQLDCCDIEEGLTDAEFDRIEHEYGFEFADDHRAFLAAGLPVRQPREEGQTWTKPWPDWRHGDPDELREHLNWPVDCLRWDVLGGRPPQERRGHPGRCALLPCDDLRGEIGKRRDSTPLTCRNAPGRARTRDLAGPRASPAPRRGRTPGARSRQPTSQSAAGRQKQASRVGAGQALPPRRRSAAGRRPKGPGVVALGELRG